MNDTVHTDTFTRHRGPVTCVASVPSSRKVITSGYDGAVGLFDLESGEASLLGYHKHLVNRVAVNETGTRAASVSADYSICLWNLETGEVERILLGHSDDVEDFIFINDATGVSVSQDQRIIRWNLATGAITRIMEGHDKGILKVEHMDGKLYTSGDKKLLIWDFETGELCGEWGPFEKTADSCSLDVRNNRIILGCDDGRIRIFDLVTGESVGEIDAHAFAIKKVAVSPVSGDILSAAYDQDVWVWDSRNLELKVKLENRTARWERSFNWSSDGKEIVAGTFDGTVLVWDSDSGSCKASLGDCDKVTGNACFNDLAVNDSGELALASDDGYVRLAQIGSEGGEWLSCVSPAPGNILMNAIMMDDELDIVAGGSHDQALHIFRKRGGDVDYVRRVPLNEGPVNCIRIARHGGYEGVLFSGCYNGTIVRTSVDGEYLGAIRLHSDAVKSLRIHATEPVGVSGSADGALLSWTLDGELLRHYGGNMSIIDDVDIDPSGRLLASTGRDFTLKIYELFTGQLLHSVALGHQSPKALMFWDENIVIVSNYWGYLIRVDLNAGSVLRKRIAGNGISCVGRTGEFIVAASYDGGIYLVEPVNLAPVSILRAMTQRVTEETIG